MRPWYARYPADYDRKTAHLSFVQDGAYNRLLDRYYMNGGPLPADINAIYRMVRASERAERDAVVYVLAHFFELRDGCYHQPRADEEIAEAERIGAAKAKAGQKGAEQRWRNGSKPIADAMAEPSTSHKQIDAQSQSHTQTQGEEGVERSRARASPSKPKPECFTGEPKPKTPRATRWPPDAVVPDDWLELGRRRRAEAGLTDIDLRLQARLFANYWSSKAGGSAAHMDWQKTWVNWCLKAYENGNNQRQSGRGRSGLGVFADMLANETEPR